MLLDSAQAYRRSLAIKWVKDGISQQEVAQRLEVTQGAISQWVARDREGGEEALKTQPRSGRLMAIMDQINKLQGRGAVRWGMTGDSAAWHLRSQYLSSRWTTRWEELPRAKLR